MCLEVNSIYIKKKNAKIGLKLHISAILWTFWLKSGLAKPQEHLDAECWRPRSENQSFTNLTAAAVGIPSLYILSFFLVLENFFMEISPFVPTSIAILVS